MATASLFGILKAPAQQKPEKPDKDEDPPTKRGDRRQRTPSPTDGGK
jgi:hypothetical protein